MPLPPWLATPVGLFRASRRASSKTMACSSRRMNASGGPALSPSSLAFGLGPAAVHPHLSAAHQLVDQAARGAFQLAKQEVVQALAGAVGGNGDHAHGRLVASGLGGVLGGHQAVYSVTLGGRDKGLISVEVTQGQKPSFRRIRHSARPPPAGRPC
ncbi:hypothetical protein G6F60_014671 [Rhizopus arrhizus]|nr:hypothetical protein G6F60_014671 [Rhizopus arrhizus]